MNVQSLAGAAETAPPASLAADFMVLEGITKTFNTASGANVHALQRIDLSIAAGQFASVIGASGCGKTTLMRIIAGLELDYGGRVAIAGRTQSGPSRDIGIVFQDPNLLPWRTIVNNVMLPAEVLELERNAALDRAHSLIGLVGLAGFETRYPSELSGGMRQRAAIARALVHDPSVLLMDEPFGALDALTRETMNLELLKIWTAARKTVFMITHSITEAVFMSDRVIVMTPRPGRVIDDVLIELPRPRTLDMMSEAQFGEYTRKLRRLLNEAQG